MSQVLTDSGCQAQVFNDEPFWKGDENEIGSCASAAPRAALGLEGSTERPARDETGGAAGCLVHSYFILDMQELSALLSLPERHLHAPCPVSDLTPAAALR